MPHAPRIVIAETLSEVCAKWLTERAEVCWCGPDDGESWNDILAEADALIVRTYTQVTAELLAAAPKLKVVGRAGVGLDNIDLEACRRANVAVVYTPDANTQAVVEYVTALILDHLRPREPMAGPLQPEVFHGLRRDLVGRQLDRLTLGILGFGRIGRRVGEVAAAIGMKVLVNDLLPESELRARVSYGFDFVDKPALYAGSDVLTIHVDGRRENRHLIDAAALSQLRPSALLLNTARGFVIDAAALAEWARSAAVVEAGGAAMLDVHDPEPPPMDYALADIANVTLLPHIASRTHEAMENMSWVVRDVWAMLEGRAPEHPA